MIGNVSSCWPLASWHPRAYKDDILRMMKLLCFTNDKVTLLYK